MSVIIYTTMATRTGIKRRHHISRDKWTWFQGATGPLALLVLLIVCVATLLFVRFQILLSALFPTSLRVYNIYWTPKNGSFTSGTSVKNGDRPEAIIQNGGILHFQSVPSQVSFPFRPTFKQRNLREELKLVIQGLEDFVPEDYLAEDEEYFVPRKPVVNSYMPGVLIQAKQTCRGDGPFLLVIVPSVYNHTIRRKAIRRTWASPAYGHLWPRRSISHEVKVIFFFGTRSHGRDTAVLREEAAIYGDIVQTDFLDTYRNLTLKMAAALHWSATYCSSARHVIKVDEDTVVNLPLLLDLLDIVSKRQGRYIMGFRHYHPKPVVTRTGRWKIEADYFPLQHFPRYVYGHSYVISGDVIPGLVHAYQHMPAVPVEDAMFTGVLAKSVGVTRIHCAHFAHQLPKGVSYDGCSLARDEFVSHTGFGNSLGIYLLWGNVTSLKC